MIVKTIRISKALKDAWVKKFGKNGDQRIRDLMLMDLKK